jgi:phosphoribosylanthranilate isomerase
VIAEIARRPATPLIKVCGLTRPADAEVCVTLGVDLLGVIFAASPRQADLATAREIRRSVPHATLVGVFVDPSDDEVLTAVEQVGIDVLQLHGNEPEARCIALGERTARPVLKVVRSGESAPVALDAAVLFDLRKGAGGTPAEREQLWSEAREARSQGRTVILAGGLMPGNVAAAVAAVRPHGVDVCRGVEVSPGVKDHAALKQLVEEVRSEHSDDRR